MRVAVILLFACYFVTVCGQSKRPYCRSGVIGPICSGYGVRCKVGYECQGGRCCGVCPKGMDTDGQCNHTPGQARCGFGYDCINNMCCANRLVCPRRPSKIPCMTQARRVRPSCRSDADCGKGKLCCWGACGFRYCTRGVMKG